MTVGSPPSAGPGAYVLLIRLDSPLTITRPRPATLNPGLYAYCGSANGPGGLAARVARHQRRGKAVHWHIDALTGAGTIIDVRSVPRGRECDLLAALLDADAVAPLPGFGSTDCRRCPAHLVRLSEAAAPANH